MSLAVGPESAFSSGDLGGTTKWPLRFRFNVILTSTDPLLGPGISILDMLEFPRFKRFDGLTDKQDEELFRRCEDHWRRWGVCRKTARTDSIVTGRFCLGAPNQVVFLLPSTAAPVKHGVWG